MILGWLDEAQKAGARLAPACRELNLNPCTIQRWRSRGADGDDGRHGPKTTPHNKLSEQERQHVLSIANSPMFRDLSPKQIVPHLADQGIYVASEATFYRILREEDLLTSRGRAKPASSKRPTEHVANGPNQVWSWDITYLRSPVKGRFFYLYLYVDIWSRKIVGHRVENVENGAFASELLQDLCALDGVDPTALTIHQDNGAPMKGATFKATMEQLGITSSYSRPHVSDDNAFSESLFRTLKYRPSFPRKPFEDLNAARAWVEEFIDWYNNVHLHSAIGFVTPSSKHDGEAEGILQRRRDVYSLAQQENPRRWARSTRAWTTPAQVRLNPPKPRAVQDPPEAIAA